MTTIIQIALWLFVLYHVAGLVLPKLDILKERAKYKKSARMYRRLSRTADSDYKSGFYYGKAKFFENKLNETRYINYD